MEPILDICGLGKTYEGGQVALADVDLAINKGEIFALLGPNGAGKTTLIGAVCGLVRPTTGTIRAFGHDLLRDWRKARARIGLVPQELATDMFEPVGHAVAYSRGLFGRPRDDARVEEVLRSLSLWDKREAKIRELSGGMKRRVLIAKALAHDPDLLFLDEPTAGVDVELRRDMWHQIGALREAGVTIILTTHYIEEAEEMADRIGIIDGGRLKLVEEKHALIDRLGRLEAHIGLEQPLQAVPASLSDLHVDLINEGRTLCFHAETREERETGLARLVQRLSAEHIGFTTLDVKQSSLEDIFVRLTGPHAIDAPARERAA
ncbi:MAG: multidrug ABC transporter ATP-binding protein [Novosphingobium sp. 12-63-9]|nr:MAG: multidrug ABC transporter ATP-binding protein [Novosphingobium sp. 12-63-9]